MAAIKKLDGAKLSKARKMKFRGKKPRKPRAGASLVVMENYIQRFNKFVDDVNRKAKEYDKKEAIRRAIRNS